MSEQKFKKGDRVRGATHVGHSPHKRTYEGTIRYLGSLTAGLDTDDDGFQYVYTETLESAYTPQVGDKVRVTYEGVVGDTTPSGAFQLDGLTLFMDPLVPAAAKKVDYSVELIEKAPEPEPVFGPGTVVRGSLYTWVVTDKGSIALDTKSGRVALTDCSVNGAELARAVKDNPSLYTVAHEPPTS